MRVSACRGVFPLPPNPLQDSYAELQQARQFLEQRKFDQAQSICESLVRRYPNYVGALHTLGLVYSEQNNNEFALDCLVRALMLNPRDEQVSTALAEIYLRLGANEMAQQLLEPVKPSEARDAKALLMLADIYQEECQYERAHETYGQALAIDPKLVPAALGFGWCLSYLGQNAEAAEVFQGLIEGGVRALEPIRGLSVLPASVVKIDLLQALEKAAKEAADDVAEFENSREFLKAAFLDRAGRHAEAWEHLVRANRAVFVRLRDLIPQITERWRNSINALRAHPGKRGRNRDPDGTISLFIMGASRSGKTTMEHLIGKLHGAKCGYESPLVRDAVLRTFRAGFYLGGILLEQLPPHLHARCRQYYLEELGRRAGPAKVFTNTSPGHIHAAALMVENFPNARFIFVKRDLEDNVFRIFMTKYRNANAYSYDLKTTRDHILQYHQMIDLMAEKFPDIVRVINYEDIAGNPAAALATAADLCDLKFSHDPLPAIDTDCGCAAPYRKFMAAAQ